MRASQFPLNLVYSLVKFIPIFCGLSAALTTTQAAHDGYY